MKLLAAILLWATLLPAWAQQPPIYPPPPNYQGVPERNWDRHQWRERARYCREWRERVTRHPRLRLPPECWRR